MTRAELNQIYYINKEIEMWERDLNEEISLQSPEVTGMPRGGEIGDGTAEAAVKRLQIRETIDGLLSQLQLKRKEIYEYIAAVDDSMMRQIIMYRCLSLCTWDEVAKYVGGGNSADSVRMAFNRFVGE